MVITYNTYVTNGITTKTIVIKSQAHDDNKFLNRAIEVFSCPYINLLDSSPYSNFNLT